MGIPAAMILWRLFIRTLLGLIFLYTGASKLRHPHRFRSGIQDYQLIPTTLESTLALSTVLAFALPLMEILAGISLLSGFLLLPASIVTLILLVLFTSAMLINLLRGRQDLSCHCSGGSDAHRISWWLIGRNSLLFIGPILLLVSPADPFTPDVLMHRSSPFDAALWLNVALPAVLLVIAVLGTYVLLNAARVLRHD